MYYDHFCKECLENTTHKITEEFWDNFDQDKNEIDHYHTLTCCNCEHCIDLKERYKVTLEPIDTIEIER